jgi:hypothetical protein
MSRSNIVCVSVFDFRCKLSSALCYTLHRTVLLQYKKQWHKWTWIWMQSALYLCLISITRLEFYWQILIKIQYIKYPFSGIWVVPDGQTDMTMLIIILLNCFANMRGQHSDQAMGWTIQVQIPGGTRDVLLLQIIQIGPGAHPPSYTVHTRNICQG